jgi:Prp8 binding protein
LLSEFSSLSPSVLWNIDNQYQNYGLLTGHNGAILDLQWSRDSGIIFSASADTLVASWDVHYGTRVRRYTGHGGPVNAVEVSKRGKEMLVTGSDDCSIGIWDPRSKAAVVYLQTEYPITAIATSETGTEIYSGGIDNDIRAWDTRTNKSIYSMLGHNDTITSLSVSPDSQSLLSYALDGTTRTWDIRPFAPTERNIRVFDGCIPSPESNLSRACWSPSGDSIAAGSGDGTVMMWSCDEEKLLHKIPGHKGTVNCVEISPRNDSLCM